MTNLIQRWRVPLALVVAAHGIGHVLFIVPLLGIADWGQSSRSWLLGSGLMAQATGSLLWLAAGAGFIILAGGLIRPIAGLRSVAVGASLVSLAGLVVFWASPASSSAFFAAMFDIVVLLGVYVTRSRPARIAGV